METPEILEILADWNFWKGTRDTGIERPVYLDALARLARTGQVVAVMGVRRSGKSTIMLQHIKRLIESGTDPKNILYVNFEDLRFGETDLALLNKIWDIYLEHVLPSAKPFVFLDEIHKVAGWERFARTMHELGKAQVFVSGSNTGLMSGRLASVLTGRHLDLSVSPLDFGEFLLFRGIHAAESAGLAAQRHKIRSLFNEYLEHGGFPLVCLSEAKKEILSQYFEDIINKDIVENYRVSNVQKLRSLSKFYLSNAARRVSFNGIARSFHISLSTVERYSHYMQEAYLLHFIKKFSPSVKEQERTMGVVYVADNGIMNVLGFKLSEDLGWACQNTVANHLIRKHGGGNIFYWAGVSGEEVDFVVKDGEKVGSLIQVCYDIGSPKTKDREMKALIKAGKELRCSRLFVLSDSYEGEENIGRTKIVFKPLWKWLLGF